jgi:hypothetical protein
MSPTNVMPPTLGDAMASEPLWLQAWLAVLVVTNLLAVLFVVTRRSGRWSVRAEPLAILVAFFASGILMEWLYTQVGYVRLLGLAHLVFWGPVWAWLVTRRAEIGTSSWFGRYVHLYLVVAGISLAIDTVDVIRHLLGDGQLLD